MTNPHEWARLARFLAGECTPEEAEEIRRWLEADPERQRLADELRPVWDAAATPSTAWDTPASWQRLAARVRARERRSAVALVQPGAFGHSSRKAPWWLTAAAAAAMIVAGGLLWRAAPPRSTPPVAANALREVRTAPTQRTVFRLADGSRVVLAPGSVLRYDATRFGRGGREIYLEGRAYFEVVHDARRPFLVRTPRAVTEDLGTEFVVTDYPADAAIEVAVASGAVAVRHTASDRTLPATMLARNDLVRFDGAGRAAVHRGIDVASRLAWTEGRLVFVDTPVADVIKDLNRWYGLDVRLGDAALAGQRFTASYTTQPDSVVVREFATAIGARIERRGAAVTLVR